MGIAIELYFDQESEEQIRLIRDTLFEHGIPGILDRIGERPHITLAVLPEVQIEMLLPMVESLAAETGPFPIGLSAIGTFPTFENVLYLAPPPTTRLLQIHETFHNRLVQADFPVARYYHPEKWVPHCTLDMEIPNAFFVAAIELCKRHFKPFEGHIQEIGIVRFRPVEVISQFPLSGRD